MSDKALDAGCGCVALLWVALCMVVTGALYYAAFHFIMKYW